MYHHFNTTSPEVRGEEEKKQTMKLKKLKSKAKTKTKKGTKLQSRTRSKVKPARKAKTVVAVDLEAVVPAFLFVDAETGRMTPVGLTIPKAPAPEPVEPSTVIFRHAVRAEMLAPSTRYPELQAKVNPNRYSRVLV